MAPMCMICKAELDPTGNHRKAGTEFDGGGTDPKLLPVIITAVPAAAEVGETFVIAGVASFPLSGAQIHLTDPSGIKGNGPARIQK